MRTGVGLVVRRPHVARDVLAAVVHHELDAVAANRLEIGAAYDECDVLACEREPRADIAADGTCSNDRDLHRILRHASSGSSSWPPPKLECAAISPPRRTRTAQYLNSGILPNGSSAAFVSLFAAAS